MTPQERDLVTRFLDNLLAAPRQQPDSEADSLIRQAMQRRPDAYYLLAQQGIVQQLGLEQAEQRIRELEERLARATQPSTTPASSSFLGDALARRSGGGWRNDSPPQGVPGSLATNMDPRGNWSGSNGGWGGQNQPAYTPPPPRSGFGSFLASAATTAAGVAGGALLFQGIQNWFGGHGGSHEATNVTNAADSFLPTPQSGDWDTGNNFLSNESSSDNWLETGGDNSSPSGSDDDGSWV